MSLSNKPYANHIMALNARKNDKLNGINSTLLVQITYAYKKERKVKCLQVVFLKKKKNESVQTFFVQMICLFYLPQCLRVLQKH